MASRIGIEKKNNQIDSEVMWKFWNKFLQIYGDKSEIKLPELLNFVNENDGNQMYSVIKVLKTI